MLIYNGTTSTVDDLWDETPQQIRFRKKQEETVKAISKNRFLQVERDQWLVIIYGCTTEARNLKKKIRRLNQVIAKKAPEKASGAVAKLKASQAALAEVRAYTRVTGLAMAFILDDDKNAKLHWQRQRFSPNMIQQASHMCLSLVPKSSMRRNILFHRTEYGRNFEKSQYELLADAITIWLTEPCC